MTKAELLALTYNDIDLEKRTISVNKSYQRIEGRDIITPPKTPKSKRIITIPPFLTEELKEYTSHLYGIMADERMFRFTKSYMEHEIIRGIKASGVKRIRLHDIRHPYVKPTTKKFITFFERFPGSRIAAHSCLIRYSWLMPPFPVFLFLKSPALHIQSQSGLPERYRPY